MRVSKTYETNELKNVRADSKLRSCERDRRLERQEAVLTRVCWCVGNEPMMGMMPHSVGPESENVDYAFVRVSIEGSVGEAGAEGKRFEEAPP